MALLFSHLAALRRRPILALLLVVPLLVGGAGASGTLLNILIPDSKAPAPTGALQATKLQKPLYPSRLIGAPAQVPILMYHYIRVNPDPNDLVGVNLSVDPAVFAEQMQFLVDHGFQTITFDDLVAALRYGVGLPPKPVILTFDDGYADFYTAAFPVLQRLGLKATSFVITSKVEAPGYLTWDAMRAMQATGLAQFESHTVDHIELGQMPLTGAQYQLVTSKTALESHLGAPVKFVSYPSGSYNAAVENLLAGDGYEAAVTTLAGVWQRLGALDALPRVRIAGGQNLAAFAAQLGESLTAPTRVAPTPVPTVSLPVPDLPGRKPAGRPATRSAPPAPTAPPAPAPAGPAPVAPAPAAPAPAAPAPAAPASVAPAPATSSPGDSPQPLVHHRPQ